MNLELNVVGRVEPRLKDLDSAPRPTKARARPRPSGRLERTSAWDGSRPEEGVFSTRSPHHPNPIGLHRVEITEIAGTRIKVRHLEAVDGTRILDVKPILAEDLRQR